jgi:methylthioribose-1-phosphate isomerase
MMNYEGKRWRTIWRQADDTGGSIGVIDQRRLPHEFKTLTLRTMEECAEAIRNMTVRGAPLIGATAAYGICFRVARRLRATRVLPRPMKRCTGRGRPRSI